MHALASPELHGGAPAARQQLPCVTVDGVQLYSFDLSAPGADASVLDADERARAARFAFARDRERFVRAHAALRAVLGACCQMPPSTLRFERSATGKPQLMPEGPAFNLSHAGDIAVLAVAQALSNPTAVGVDVECLDQQFDVDALAAEHFSPAERSAVHALPPAQRMAGFLAVWTRKEALLKACGLGLTVATAEIEVGLGPTACVVTLPALSPRTWRVTSVALAAGSVVAVARDVAAGR